MNDPRIPPKTYRYELIIIDLLTVLFAILCVVIVTFVMLPFNARADVYGFTLFLGVPMVCGMLRALLGASYQIPHDVMLKRIWFPMLILPLSLLFLGIEGGICILMAAPIVAVAITFGLLLGYAFGAVITPNGSRILIALISIGLLATAQLYESRLDRTPPLWAVTTQLHIAASPEDVWEQVVTFDSLEEPDELMFKAGLAYPTHATIEGEGPGAVRRCEFSTGTFVEPITIWDEPRLLRFDVTENPIPMKELSPYKDLSPAHLHGHFYSEQGEFRLERQSDGSTILYGTTWYRQHLWPAHYWRFWSDGVIHAIHNRVLEHIKEESEAPVRVAEKQ